MSSDFDDMPPLVEQPLPPSSFFLLPPSAEDHDDGPPPLVERPPANDDDDGCTPPALVPADAPTTPSTAKSRDSNHIPRPPNAFILFRASFVKAHAVPNTLVSGSHASLSKIVGLVWRGMGPDEKARWEQAAVRALAEHRTLYPDWRFRNAGNAVGVGGEKGSVKEKGKKGERKKGERKRKRGREKDKKEGEEGDGGGGKRRKGREKERFERIASLVRDGITGDVLASAVEAWDVAADAVIKPEPGPALGPAIGLEDKSAVKNVSTSPVGLPLTEMYRRPAPLARTASPPPFIPQPLVPALPPSPVTYIFAPEPSQPSILFDEHASLPPHGTAPSHAFDYIPSTRFTPDTSRTPSYDQNYMLPPSSPYTPLSPSSSDLLSPPPLSSPTSIWSARRSSFDSLAGGDSGDVLWGSGDFAEDPFASSSFAARSASGAGPFDPGVAIYNPTDAPASMNPYTASSTHAPDFFKLGVDSNSVFTSDYADKLNGGGGDVAYSPDALTYAQYSRAYSPSIMFDTAPASQYSSLFGWDAVRA